MTLTREPDVAEPPVPPPPTSRWRTRWYVSGAFAMILAIAAAAWWVSDSTETAADYAAAVVDLDTAEETVAGLEDELSARRLELAASREEAAGLRTELAHEHEARRALEEQLTDLRSAVDSALLAARALGYAGLHFSPEPLAALELAGADFTLADDVLDALGESHTLTEWAGLTSASRRDAALEAIGDDTLDGARSRWMEADVGSFEEAAAWYEMWWRLSWLVLDPLVRIP